MAVMLAVSAAHAQQATDAIAQANDQKAQKLLDAMVDALGDLSWSSLQDWEQHGRIAGFYQGKPTGGMLDFRSFYRVTSPGVIEERVEFGKKHDDVLIFTADNGYEITYQGKTELPKKELDDYMRRRAHSIPVVMRTWMKDPKTILIYNGQTQVERHLADKITILSPSNDAVTIEMDANSHLPVRTSFQWHDPLYGDMDTDAEEYDNYHTVQGFPTPYTITRYHNGDMVSQRYLIGASYNIGLAPQLFDADLAAKGKGVKPKKPRWK
ncbi:MAG: hypothetical protein ACYC46_03870 [Acidobacteriaceae bacterium]